MKTNEKMQLSSFDENGDRTMKNNVELNAPKNWSELTAKQLVYASWLLCQEMTAEEILVYAFVRFCNLKVIDSVESLTYFRYNKYKISLNDEQVNYFAKKLDYLVKEIGEIEPLKKMGGKAHADKRLRGVAFNQYLACENYYQAFIFKRDERFLNYLCAAFYSGEEFDDKETMQRAEKFAKLPYHVRYTVFLWYTGLKSILQKHFPNYFVKVDAMTDDAPTMPNMRKQIEQMVRALTGGDVTKANDVYKSETWTALAELDAKTRESNELKARMKR